MYKPSVRPRNKIYGIHIALLLLGIALSIFTWTSYSDHVWGIPRADFARHAREGRYDFLKQINYTEHTPQEITRLGRDAPYYIGAIYTHLDMPHHANRMYAIAWEQKYEPYAFEAGLRMLKPLSENRSFTEAQKIAGEGLHRYNRHIRYLRYYLEAVYWNREYDQLFKLLPHYRHALQHEKTYPIHNLRSRLAEAALWEAVAEYRSGRATRAHLFLRHAADFLASDYHSRIYIFLIAEPTLNAVFSEWELDFIQAKHLLNEKKYRDAARLYESIFNAARATDLAPLLTPRAIRDIGRAYLYGRYLTHGIARFSEITRTAPAHSVATAYQWYGRILRRAGRTRAAEGAFLHAFRLQQSDSHLWLALDAAYSRSFSAGQKMTARYGSRMTDRRYFSDLFERISVNLLSDGRWDRLWQLRETLTRHGADYDRARQAVIFAEAVRSGATARPYYVRHSQLRRELEFARQQTASPYYAYIAGMMLGKNPVIVYQLPRPITYQRSPHSKRACMHLINGYARYHLDTHVYNEVRRCYHHYTTDELIQLAERLNDTGIFDISLRVLNLARRRKNFHFDRSVIRLLYPLAYREYIEPFAEIHDLSPYFFYATIREESYFKSSVNSHAGAIGLGQFIPSTAHAVAQRMNIPTPDLTNPELNLKLSSFHLRELLDALDNRQIFALAAYNAGRSRAQRWKDRHPRHSFLLTHEAIPFRETRNYVRKIMVSNIRYEQLHGAQSEHAVIRSFFPDLTTFR